MAYTLRWQAEWASEDAASTPVALSDGAEHLHTSGRALVMVHNPSPDTAITVTPSIALTDADGTARSGAVDGVAAFTVPASTTEAHIVEGLIGIPTLTLTNVTAVPLGAGFVAQAILHLF